MRPYQILDFDTHGEPTQLTAVMDCGDDLRFEYYVRFRGGKWTFSENDSVIAHGTYDPSCHPGLDAAIAVLDWWVWGDYDRPHAQMPTMTDLEGFTWKMGRCTETCCEPVPIQMSVVQRVLASVRGPLAPR